MEDVHLWHGYSSTDSLLPLCRICNPRWEDLDATALKPEHDIDPPIDRRTANDYELAGRSDASHSFRDLRSPTKARKRQRQRNEKYYSGRYIKPGQLGAEHYVPDGERGWWYSSLLPEAPVAFMTAERLYREAQAYPRPPKLHRSNTREERTFAPEIRRSWRKQQPRRLEEDACDAMDKWIRYLVTGDDPGMIRSGKVLLGVSRNESTMDGCECGCALCSWEGLVLEARDRGECERVDEVEDGHQGWDMMSVRSTGAGSDDGWDVVDAGSLSTEDAWVSVEAGDTSSLSSEIWADADPAAKPVSHPNENLHDDDGPCHISTHSRPDLDTGQCWACVVERFGNVPLEEDRSARLCDVAYLHGMPAEFTT